MKGLVKSQRGQGPKVENYYLNLAIPYNLTLIMNSCSHSGVIKLLSLLFLLFMYGLSIQVKCLGQNMVPICSD